MSYENVNFECEGRVAVVTINRPKALNALNKQTFDEIEAVFKEIAADDNIGAVVVTGAGDKAFVAGADISEFDALTTEKLGEELALRGQAVFNGVANLKKPVVIAINGFALGGGLELALSGDIRFASENAKVGLPEINLGLLPGYAGTQRLSRLVGRGMANLMLMTGDMFDAAEALRMGLVQKVFPADELMGEVMKLATKLSKKAPLAMAFAKSALSEGLETDLASGQKIEANYFGRAFGTEDMREGTAAFMEKRKADFKGR